MRVTYETKRQPQMAFIGYFKRLIMNNIVNRYNNIRTIVRNTALRHKRSEDAVSLLPVSKRFPASDIRVLADNGCSHFGESYVQEGVGKVAELMDLAITWHFIGPIQSNKTRDIAQNFDWVHSLDRIKIARRLDEQRGDERDPLQVCIQVNISNEPQKSGIKLADVDAFAKEIAQCKRLTLRGLMAIPAVNLSDEQRMLQYQALKAKQMSLQHTYPRCDTLSLGMSDDLDPAIACGSTLVRVGTAIFGERLVSGDTPQ